MSYGCGNEDCRDCYPLRVILGNVEAMSDDELTEAIEAEPTPDEHDPDGFTAILRAEAERRGMEP